MKNITIYYHAYLDDNFLWSTIFLEHFKALENSGLISQANKIRFTVTTQNDDRVRMLYDLCHLYKIPIELEFIQNQYPNDREMMNDLGKIYENASKNLDERYTHQKIYDDCLKEDQNVLYLHSKGIMSIVNNLTIPGRASKYKNRFYWRQFMNNVIYDWKECVRGLETHDVSGIDYQDDPSPHFRGNFFWTKSEHVRKLPSPSDKQWYIDLKAKVNNDWLNSVCDRFSTELWVGSLSNTKFYNVRSNNGDYIANDI